jgi:hypothetical protein
MEVVKTKCLEPESEVDEMGGCEWFDDMRSLQNLD